MILLLIIIITGICLGFIYQRFRGNMGRYVKEFGEEIEKYDYSVLLKFLFLYISIGLLPVIALTSFILAYDLPLVESPVQLVILSLGILIISFANATYYTSITIEQFVMQPVKELKQYKPLRIAIKFFHGPVSHVGQYMGFNLCLLTLCLYSYFDIKDSAYINFLIPISTGVLLGVLIGYAQHLNRNWKYQLPAFIFVAMVFLALLAFKQIELKNEFSIMYLSYLIIAILFLLLKNIRASQKGERNIYSQEFWWI